jgi:hypothetical protein
MKAVITWHNEYSKTDEPDSMGRWARSAYVGNRKCFIKGKRSYFPIAWIGYVTGDKGRKYSVTLYFGQIGSGGCFDTLDEAKKSVEDQFNWFLKCVQKRSYFKELLVKLRNLNR